jgi:hypothetical protein
MKLETRAGVAVMVALAAAAGCAFILISLGRLNLLVPLGLVTVLFVTAAVIVWIVGDIRTERAFKQIRKEAPRRKPLWKYAAILAPPSLTAAVYVAFPTYGGLVWSAFFVFCAVALVWTQLSRRWMSRDSDVERHLSDRP